MSTAATIASATYQWIDVTERVVAATNTLPLGSLITDDNFGLFEAMSAIEVMDPKMDAGMMCNTELCKVGSASEAISRGLLPLDPSARDIVGISDELLACVCTWLDGHSLAQTVLTCLYLHDIPSIKSTALTGICNAALKCCDIINEIVVSSLCYEEEDFVTCTYGYDTDPGVSCGKIVASLREEIDRRTRRKEQELSPEEGALVQRLTFWKLFLVLLNKVQNFERRGMDALRADVEALYKCVTEARETLSAGTQVAQEGPGEVRTMVGFEYLVNQRLLASSPPRYIEIKSRTDSCVYLLKVLTHMELMTRIASTTTLSGIIKFFVRFSEQSPCVLSRSCLFYVFNYRSKFLGEESFGRLVKQEIRKFSYPISFLGFFSTVPKVSEVLEDFLDSAVMCILDYIHTMCHNKGRQRRKLGALLPDLSMLYSKAEGYDKFLHAHLASTDSTADHHHSYSCYVLFIIIEVMIKYLLLGWELELYTIHEAHYIYCYLEYLFSWLKQSVIRAHEQCLSGEAFEKRLVKRNKNMKRKKLERNHQMVLQMAEVYQTISRAYIKSFEGFAIQGKLDQFLERRFDDESLRFKHRFAPFNIAIPMPLEVSSYPTLRYIVDNAPPGRESELFRESLHHFTSVKTTLEKIPPQQSADHLAKVVKMNCVQLGLLINGHCKDSANPPILDFSVCHNVPFLKIT